MRDPRPARGHSCGLVAGRTGGCLGAVRAGYPDLAGGGAAGGCREFLRHRLAARLSRSNVPLRPIERDDHVAVLSGRHTRRSRCGARPGVVARRDVEGNCSVDARIRQDRSRGVRAGRPRPVVRRARRVRRGREAVVERLLEAGTRSAQVADLRPSARRGDRLVVADRDLGEHQAARGHRRRADRRVRREVRLVRDILHRAAGGVA